MFRQTQIALLCASLLAGIVTPSVALANSQPVEPVMAGENGVEPGQDTWAPVMPALGVGDADFPLDASLFEHADLWDRIRKGFGITDLNNPLVSSHTAVYAAHPAALVRIGERASRYLFYVVQELEKRGMPTELALLPVIESEFNPQAYSRAKAAGMWQFIPSTGRAYNLKQNAFRDERRDVVASTNAALSYLQLLYGKFGDWQIALAAYNWGEGSVQKAMARARAAGKRTDYNGLSAFMPAETRHYYPKLQAVKNIIAVPAQYGIKLPAVENQPYFTSVRKTRDIDVKLAAELAELPLEEFKALNPQFNRPVITGSADTHILLPRLNAEKFRENLSSWTRALSSWTSLKISAARERIETIAAQLKTTPQVIREANAIPPNMQPTAGSTLIVPKTGLETGEIGQETADNAVLGLVPEGGSRRQCVRGCAAGREVRAVARGHQRRHNR